MKECPKCRLANADIAERCDCGYDFPTGSMKRPYLTFKSRRVKAGAGAGLSLSLIYILLRLVTSINNQILSIIFVMSLVALILIVAVTRRRDPASDEPD